MTRAQPVGGGAWTLGGLGGELQHLRPQEEFPGDRSGNSCKQKLLKVALEKDGHNLFHSLRDLFNSGS